MANHREGGRDKSISLKLDPAGNGAFLVRATKRGGNYPYTNNPIGRVARNDKGGWSHSSAHNPGAGPIYGNARTPALAAAACYRSHAAWVGY